VTFKKGKDGKARATFAIWLRLTEDEVAAITRLADSEGKLSCRQKLKEIAVQAIAEKIGAAQAESK